MRQHSTAKYLRYMPRLTQSLFFFVFYFNLDSSQRYRKTWCRDWCICRLRKAAFVMNTCSPLFSVTDYSKPKHICIRIIRLSYSGKFMTISKWKASLGGEGEKKIGNVLWTKPCYFWEAGDGMSIFLCMRVCELKW